MGRKEKDATPQEKQHFSHPHTLKLVNVHAQVQALTCNACEKPNTNNNFYGCNSCRYFLHENCLNAPRFLDHAAHHSHPLTLQPIPTYSARSFTCNACGSAGNGFSFSCASCEFDIHLECASCPSSTLLDKHSHKLQLLFASPYEDKHATYVCDICNVTMNGDTWLYYCAACDFASHLHCANHDVNVFPKRRPNRNPNPNPNQSPNPSSSGTNPTVGMINSVNEAHEQVLAAQLQAQIEARGREACLDLFRPARRYSYY